MKKIYAAYLLLAFCCSFIGNAQQQSTGFFAAIDGGVEGQADGNLPVATINNGLQKTTYTVNASISAATIVNDIAAARSGSKYLTWNTGGAGVGFCTPTLPNGAVENNQPYIIQFYYKQPSGTARALQLALHTDGINGSLPVTTNILSNTNGWTLVNIPITSGNSTNNPKYGMLRVSATGGAITNFQLDDLVVYPGTTVDNTPPAAPIMASAQHVTNHNIDLQWNAPQTGVDGGGYLIVRGNTDPTTLPNEKGIYGVGNNIGTNGTVVYSGSATSFNDNGLNPGTPYYYRIYSVDKAFNYSLAAVVATGTSGSLPVKLTFFNAGKQGAKNLLHWETENELNSLGFDVERSANGKNFSVIHFTPTKQINGSASNLGYDYMDEKPLIGTNYYRLKQRDKDGQFSYSSIVLLRGTKVSKIVIQNIYPNPVANQLNMAIGAPKPINATVVISDLMGKIILNTTAVLAEGDNNISIDVMTIKRGTYFVKITGDDKRDAATGRFIKQ